jgi:hypothetical protein
MRRTIYWTAALSMTLGGAGFLAASAIAAAENPPGAANAPAEVNRSSNSGEFALPDGITPKNLNQEKDIRREAFGKATAAAVQKDGLSNLVDRLVDQDRERIGQYKQQKNDALDDVISKFQGQWKAKYGKDFDMTRAEDERAFSGVQILQGQVDNPDMLAGKWPIAQPMTATARATDERAQQAANRQDVQTAKSKAFGGDVNLDKGRDVAVVKVPATMGLPDVYCSLIKEHTTGWRFDIPNNITGQQLHDNLVKHLTTLADHPEQWPADADQAYGLVGHHVVMALYDVEPTSRGTNK